MIELRHQLIRSLACLGVLAFGFSTSLEAVQAAEPKHGLSIFGDLKYGADFKAFDYVNPTAPKGGGLITIGTGAVLTFDSFNAFILKGDPAQGLGLVYDALMTRAYDEPDALYGLVAESIVLADDRKSITFKIRAAAKFADGSAVTADDCVFSIETMKEKGHPLLRVPLRNVVKAEAIDAQTVKYSFQGEELRDLPSLVATLPVLPRKFYAARPFDETWLDKPLGSGPYEIGDFKQGTFVSYKRRTEYWARDLNVNRGRHNFDEIRYDYFRDRTAGLQALKSGQLDLREEFTSKEWATGYEIPPVKDGRMILATLPDKSPSGTQGFFLNVRKPKFQDIRLRKALDLAFDYEWTNKNLFYGLYTRTTSYFENSPMKALGEPSTEEIALLAPFKDKLDASVFKTAYVPPVSDASGQDRKMLGEAVRLISEAGWEVKNGKRVNSQGEALEIEFLITDPTSERLLSGYVKNLGALGINAQIRRVDEAQYQRRLKSFDYDVVISRFSMLLTPGLELKQYFGSEAAGTDGSRNLSGIASPVVDALLDKITGAKTRQELDTSTRALDRVLRVGHYWVPHWYKASHTLAHWNKFAWPEKKPDYDRGITDTWWYDAEKGAKLKTN
jgi:microcin C transport system substrate-binding protein